MSEIDQSELDSEGSATAGSTSDQVPKFTPFRAFVLPALTLFAIPAFAWPFFVSVQRGYDQMYLDNVRQAMEANPQLNPGERVATLFYYEEHPLSELLTSDEPGVAKAHRDVLAPAIVRYYTVFRWAILLSQASIFSGLAAFAVALISVWFSRRSQRTQYWSLFAGWHTLRVFSTLQVLVQGVLLVALSFWITAWWMNFYSVKLVAIVGFVALIADAAVIKAIFQKASSDFEIEGMVFQADQGGELWNELKQICDRMDTAPPDQIVAGIDDNFFVTEQELKVGEQKCRGRTLYISLSLLKHLDGDEAAAVLAHEMAHFSGQDTLYSKKISPLLRRFDVYLYGLYSGGLSRVIFYFMYGFRGFMELSLRSLSREREFRADALAADMVSPKAIAHSLLRIAVFAHYRNKIEVELFNQQEVLTELNIASRIAAGFPAFAAKYVEEHDVDAMEVHHPFDSHPPMGQRCAAVGVQLDKEQQKNILLRSVDGQWFHRFPRAAELEQEQWAEYERRFREYHEQVLAYRYLPANEAEAALVERFFPPREFTGRKGAHLVVNYDKIVYSAWDDPVRFDEVEYMRLNEGQILRVSFRRDKFQSRDIKLKHFGNDEAEVLQRIGEYSGRCEAAKAYQAEITGR